MFSKLLGNDQIKEAFLRMMKNDRFPRSALFVGQDGVGKKRFALEIAKAFLCHHPQDLQACDNCTSCKRSEVFTFATSDKRDDYDRVFLSEHLDIGQVISFKRTIGVGAIRELEREANFRPYEGKARFFIVDDAERMNDSASNALLKTLEEPSPTTYIFLITSRPLSMLQTIRSRCQIIRFSPIEADKIESFLVSTHRYSPIDAKLLSRVSAGSIGQALSLDLDLFKIQRDRMTTVLGGILNRKISSLLQISDQLGDAKLKDEYETHLEILQTLIHDLWTIQVGGTNIVNVDLREKLEASKNRISSKQLANCLSQIEAVRENLTVNLNKKIATDALFLQLAKA